MWIQIATSEWAIFSGTDMPGHVRRHSAMSCAKIAEPIKMSYGLWTRVGQRKQVLGGVYTVYTGEYH